MAWTENDIYVTASNPPPGRVHAFNNTYGPPGSSSDGGVGVNVYIAGGTGPGGAIPVTGTLGVQMSLSGASITTDPNINISSSIPLDVIVQNWPVSSSVYVINQPSGSTSDVRITGSTVTLGVSGNVGVVGTASVSIVGTSGPLNVSGTVAVSNFPAIQTVTGSVTVQGISLSGSTPPEAIPNSLDNIVYVRKAQRFDLTSDLVNYIGYAAQGTNPASASWTIKRLSFDASGSLELQEWSSQTGTWSNRASEVYS